MKHVRVLPNHRDQSSIELMKHDRVLPNHRDQSSIELIFIKNSIIIS